MNEMAGDLFGRSDTSGGLRQPMRMSVAGHLGILRGETHSGVRKLALLRFVAFMQWRAFY